MKKILKEGGGTYRTEEEYRQDLDQVKNLPSIVKKSRPSETSGFSTEPSNLLSEPSQMVKDINKH